MKNTPSTTAARLIPTRRTARTLRVVVQRFDPDAGRYRDMRSFRLEAGPDTLPESVASRLAKILTEDGI